MSGAVALWSPQVQAPWVFAPQASSPRPAPTSSSRPADLSKRTEAIEGLRKRFGDSVRAVKMSDSSQAAAVIEGAELLLNAGGAGICLVPRDAWAGRAGLRAVADVNAVPPLGSKGSR